MNSRNSFTIILDESSSIMQIETELKIFINNIKYSNIYNDIEQIQYDLYNLKYTLG